MKANNKASILVVDDNDSNLNILEKLLGEEYQILRANSANEAFDILLENNKNRIQLIFLDVMMPEMNGIEFCKKIRREYDDPYVKIIFVTAKSYTADMLEGYEAGCDDYITKPINLYQVRAKAEVFTQFYQSETQLKDINNNLQLEVESKTKELLRKETLTAIGIQTAQIVHDLQSPLQVISLSHFMLKNELGDHKAVKSLQNGIDSLGDIITTILQAGKDFSEERKQIDLKNLIELAVSRYRTLTDTSKITFRTSLESPINILGNKIHFQQIFDNFLKNSVEAISEEQNEGVISINHQSDGNYEIISIEDNGPGISEAIQRKVFKPFFTTKDGNTEIDGGTGLGLSSCKRMIEAYGGNISLDQNKNTGCRFIIKIPSSNTINA